MAWAIPRVLRAAELESEPIERSLVEAKQRRGPRGLPTRLVPRFSSRWSVETEDWGPDFPAYVLTPKGRSTPPTRTLFYVHGGGFTVGFDGVHTLYASKLADALDARIVLPDYPLAPRSTWRDSHDALIDGAARWAGGDEPMVLAGDSAGGNLALVIAQAMRDRRRADADSPVAEAMILHAPWVDLTTSAPGTPEAAALDPWLKLSKIPVYAEWWAGSPDELARPEVSPGLADLSDLPRTLMFFGTHDVLAPGCRELTRRGAAAGWDLYVVEEPGLIHVYGIMPGLPEARRAFAQAVEFLT